MLSARSLRSGSELLLRTRAPCYDIPRRSYTGSTTLMDEEASTKPAAVSKEEKLYNKLAARDYNNRRAAYKRQVKILRREYKEEVEKQQKADQAAREALREKLTRQHLEHQRRKNIRSAQNALREKEIREQRHREFMEHLKYQQQLRDAKNERYRIARQMVIDELEEEAPLWLTTPEEVEAAFTPEAEQLLWGRPGGVLGAPNPSLDSHFWQFETHTWHMDKTYPSQREVLLEDLQEMVYDEANIDKKFWTEERIREQERLEEKAKLRAMVQSAGRTELLRKQRFLIDEDASSSEIPQPARAPSMAILNKDWALEEEGARVLIHDPTKFFRFENEQTNVGVKQDAQGTAEYQGPTLGVPIGLRDPLRENEQGTVFPKIIGRLPKPDTRSERERKQDERQEKMWAAAQAEAAKEANVDMAAEDQSAEDLEPDLDYDNLEWDSDEEDWKRGLDPETDADILNTPRERRFSERDIDWVLDKLGSKVKFLDQQLTQDMDRIKQEARAEIRAKAEKEGTADVVEPDSLEEALLNLSDKEMLALSDLDDRYTESMPADEFAEAAKAIPGLTEEQLKFILSRDKDDDSKS